MNEQINHNSRQQYAQLLQEFNTKVEHEINLIQQGVRVIKKQEESEEIHSLKRQLKPLIDSIATTGDASNFSWAHLRSLLVMNTRDVLQSMQTNYPYVKQPGINEGFEDELDVILQFMCGFESKPPFTMQRICELLLTPERYYKSSKKILFAMEKVVLCNNI